MMNPMENHPQEWQMSGHDHVYKSIEITGTSMESMEKAVHQALSRASKTVRNMRWFEVVQVRGDIVNNTTPHWQVVLKVGFILEE